MDKRIHLKPAYVDGVIKLHEQLFASYQKAFEVAKKCVPNISDKFERHQTINIFVDFKENQSGNTFKGYFVFAGIVFRYLTITFDIALLFRAKDHNNENPSAGFTYRDVEQMRSSRLPICFSFCYIIGDESFPKMFRRIRAVSAMDDSPIYPHGSFNPIRDDIGLPFYSFDDIQELQLKKLPQRFRSTEFSLRGKDYYAPYSTTEEAYCVLYAQTDNEYDGNAIKVCRWFPIDKQTGNDIILEDRNWGDCFFEWGYISREENEELHTFMMQDNSRLLFGKIKEDKITLLGGVDYFVRHDFHYPICLHKIPVK